MHKPAIESLKPLVLAGWIAIACGGSVDRTDGSGAETADAGGTRSSSDSPEPGSPSRPGVGGETGSGGAALPTTAGVGGVAIGGGPGTGGSSATAGVPSQGGGGSSQGGQSEGGAPPFPRTPDGEEVTAFLATRQYTNAPWTTDDPAGPRPGDPFGHGDQVRLWLNDSLFASLAAGNGLTGGQAHPTDSVAVMELYDETGATLLGHAVMLKLEGGFNSWLYYCAGPDLRCVAEPASRESPYVAAGASASCQFCHGGQILSRQL